MIGSLVIAKCCGDRPELARVFRADGRAVYLARAVMYDKLTAVGLEPPYVGFPPHDVFTFDQQWWDAVESGKRPDWNSLRTFKE